MKKLIFICITVMLFFTACKKEGPSVLNENILPKANAGSDKCLVLPDNSIILTGHGESMNGSIVSYTWSKISGPPSFAIHSPGSSETSITDLEEGTYVFELKVTDDKGKVATDRVVILVSLTDPCCSCWDY